VSLVSADIYRPAAIEQLKILAEGLGAGFFNPSDRGAAVRICVEAGRLDAGRPEPGRGALWIGDIRFFK